jgi:transcriptional regulator with XRE-family HTH domain
MAARPVRGFRHDVLKTLREQRGLSLQQLGDLLGGVQRAQVWSWEDGRTVPSARRLVGLATALGVDPYDLLDVDPAHPTLHDLRVRRGLTAKELAERTGLSYEGMVHRLDIGQGPEEISPQVARELADALGMDPADVAAACARSRQARVS